MHAQKKPTKRLGRRSQPVTNACHYQPATDKNAPLTRKTATALVKKLIQTIANKQPHAHQLTARRTDLLRAIERLAPISVDRLHRDTKSRCSPRQLRRQIQALRALGLVKAVADDKHERRQLWFITAEGMKALDHAHPSLSALTRARPHATM